MTDEQFKEIKEEFMAARKLQWAIYFLIAIVMFTQKCHAQDTSSGYDWHIGDTLFINHKFDLTLSSGIDTVLHGYDTVPWKPYYKPKKKKKSGILETITGVLKPSADGNGHTTINLKFVDIHPITATSTWTNDTQVMHGGSMPETKLVLGNASNLPIAQPKQDPWYKIKWPSFLLGIAVGIVLALSVIVLFKMGKD